jgi:hypothetical protein
MLQSIAITKKELHRGIKQLMKLEGFKFSPDGAGGGILIKRFSNDDFWWVSYQVNDNAHYHSLYDLGFWIRIGAVEKLLFDFIPKFTNNYIRPDYWPTYTQEWGFYGWSEKEQERFTSIKSIEDIQTVITEFESLYFQKKSKFFETYHDISVLDQILNSTPENISNDYDVVGAQIILRYLTIAKLAKNPKFEELVSIYKQKIAGVENQVFQETFNEFVIYLTTYELPKWQRPW